MPRSRLCVSSQTDESVVQYTKVEHMIDTKVCTGSVEGVKKSTFSLAFMSLPGDSI